MNRYVNLVFYTLKPMIPRALQLLLRRHIAQYKRHKYAYIWPIDPNAAAPPPGWTGWPGGKQFALVLSHDVDTLEGYRNVLKLADIEEKMGFRSAFNFVPERYGAVSLDLLEELRARGFGIGVHGLKHDGKLFASKNSFDRQALRINGYLKAWQTRGFSSPSMHHNLDWLTGLDIDYATSTFDTDPFEPQSDGLGTIFPLWVPNGAPNHGYVELPYTLPQDSTLFIILKEKNIAVWQRKLAWIAGHGGMALVNTHTDYMHFGQTGEANMQYPVEFYTAFLDDLRSRYTDQYYHALPEEVAEFWKITRQQRRTTVQQDPCVSSHLQPHDVQNLPAAPADKTAGRPNRVKGAGSKRLRVAMLTYSFYEVDNRVRRYAEALARRGDAVDVFSLRRQGQNNYNELNGVRIFRIQERVRDERGKLNYLVRILKFFFRSARSLARMHLAHAYDLVHVHSVPDFEVFAALVPKMTGARVVLDIHDIVPEFYAAKFNVGRASLVYRMLIWVEKLSIAFADHVIISNDLWKEKLCSRSVRRDKCTTIINYPDGRLFFSRKAARDKSKVIYLYPGTLNHHQGLDLAVKAFDKIKDLVRGSELHIIGDGPAKAQLAQLVSALGLEGRVLLQDPVPLDDVAEIMAAADIGIIPKRNDGFGGEAFSTKTLEFMTLGVPIIVSKTQIDQFYFDDSIVKFFEPGNVDELAAAMQAMIKDKSLMSRLSVNAHEFAQKNSWEIKKDIYFNLVEGLVEREDRVRRTDF